MATYTSSNGRRSKPKAIIPETLCCTAALSPGRCLACLGFLLLFPPPPSLLLPFITISSCTSASPSCSCSFSYPPCPTALAVSRLAATAFTHSHIRRAVAEWAEERQGYSRCWPSLTLCPSRRRRGRARVAIFSAYRGVRRAASVFAASFAFAFAFAFGPDASLLVSRRPSRC